MKKIWFLITGLWVVSIIYFLVYVNDPLLRTAVDAHTGLAILHGVMDVLLIGGGGALIIRLIYRITHPRAER